MKEDIIYGDAKHLITEFINQYRELGYDVEFDDFSKTILVNSIAWVINMDGYYQAEAYVQEIFRLLSLNKVILKK